MLKYILFVFTVLVVIISCNDDVFDRVQSSGNLQFSKDTVFLDTIFTNISSSTRTLKIYNRSDNNITIPKIQLGRGENSFYRLNVDGASGKIFENVDVLSKDSLFVFIEATIDYGQITNPIYTDSIVFDSGANLQDVKLVTLVQDAYFLFPKQGEERFYLEADAEWKNDKPYVIYGSAIVSKNGTLTIGKGVHVHFHDNSGLEIEKGASLIINGELGEEVIFEGDRLEPIYSDIPGQWKSIWLHPGSKNHNINYAIIKNNVVGIFMDSIGNNSEPTLRIANSQIYNTTSFGLLARGSNIEGSNLVIANNGQASLACTRGGTYNFIHSTFANYWNNGVRSSSTVLINNYSQSVVDGTLKLVVEDLKAANFTNCIIDGNKNIELFLDKNDGAVFNYNFKNNMIKFNDPSGSQDGNPLYDFDDITHYQDNILNGEADFKNVDLNVYIIGDKSDAVNNADLNGAQQIPFDIDGVSRLTKPDIGAYQHIVFEEDK